MRFFEHLIVWFPLIVECSFGIIYFVCYFCGWNREAFSARFLPPVYQNPPSSFSTSTFGERYRQSHPIHTCFLFQTFPPPNIFLLFCRYWSACVDALNISPTPSIFVIFRRKFRGESPTNSPFLQQSLPFPLFPTYPSNFHLLPNDRKGSAECLL